MHAFLKKETYTLHKEIEQNSLAKFILDTTISAENYQKFLLQNYFSYLEVESAIEDSKHIVSGLLLDFIGKNKSNALRKDLTNFATIDLSLSNQEFSFEVNSTQEIIGALYVIEGSMLGSLIIGKQLPKCKNLSGINDFHFFRKNPIEVSKRWKQFSEIIQSFDYNQNEKNQVAESAKRTFLCFQKYQKKSGTILTDKISRS